jgi:exoribonuclease R
MIADLDICVTRKNKYVLFENSKLKKGIVSINSDKSGVVTLEDYEQIHINQREMHNAREGDVVALEITGKRGSLRTGRIIKIKRKVSIILNIINDIIPCKATSPNS